MSEEYRAGKLRYTAVKFSGKDKNNHFTVWMRFFTTKPTFAFLCPLFFGVARLRCILRCRLTL